MRRNVITVRFDDEMRRAIDTMAFDREISRSDMMRNLVAWIISEKQRTCGMYRRMINGLCGNCGGRHE